MEVDGKLVEASEKYLRERRSKIGMVFQQFNLFPHMTALQNCIEAPIEVLGMKKEEAEERALELLELVGLTDKKDQHPSRLSGGQQQRVGIARSLAIEPDIWFLDEPFSALDPLIRREMQDEFLRLQGLLGKTIVFITHDFDEALRLADRIAIMKDGMIEQCSTPDQIVLNPATEYVRKFTEEVEKARVVNVEAIMEPTGKPRSSKNALYGKKKLRDVAKILASDTREFIPVKDTDDKLVGQINRKNALDIVFGE